MATTLFNVLQRAYMAMGQMEVITATGGSTSTVISTNLGEQYGDDDLVGSSVFVIRDAGGASAAPEGEVKTVTDYVQSTYTMTLNSVLTAAVGAGDVIGIAKNVIPLETLREIANQALISLGTIQLTNTSITTTESTLEYALPVTLKYRVDRVQIQTDDTYNNYVDLHNWQIVPAAAGSTGLLVFTAALDPDKTLKIWYSAEHPRLSNYSDLVSETIHGDLAVALVVNGAYEWLTRRTGGENDFLLQTANKAAGDLQEARARYPLAFMRKSKLLIP